METYRSYIWYHQEPTRSAGTRQGMHDVTSQRIALWTSYVILKRVPAHERQSVSGNLFTFGPMLIGTFLLKWGWGIPRKSLWHRFWDTCMYIYDISRLRVNICKSLYHLLFVHCVLYIYISQAYINNSVFWTVQSGINLKKRFRESYCLLLHINMLYRMGTKAHGCMEGRINMTLLANQWDKVSEERRLWNVLENKTKGLRGQRENVKINFALEKATNAQKV
jgi:hypothetical protein